MTTEILSLFISMYFKFYRALPKKYCTLIQKKIMPVTRVSVTKNIIFVLTEYTDFTAVLC